MRRTQISLVFLSLILVATIGAGVFDIAFPDVIPNRPYTHTFAFTPVWMFVGKADSAIINIMVVVALIILVASLLRSVANITTGITISHTGFTPNTNLTGSPGTSSILQFYPLILAFIGLVAVAKYLKNEGAGV